MAIVDQLDYLWVKFSHAMVQYGSQKSSRFLLIEKRYFTVARTRKV